MTELIIASLLEYQLIFDIVRVSVECYTSVKVCKFVLTNIKAVYKHIWHICQVKSIYKSVPCPYTHTRTYPHIHT